MSEHKRVKRKKWGRVYEKESFKRALLVPDDLFEQITQGIKNMKVITSTNIAEKFGIRVSIARRILEDLNEKGEIKVYGKTPRLILYVPS